MLVVLLGFLIATAIALTGVGAGVLTAPALMLLLGLPPPVAVGTALAFGTLVKLPAVGEYARAGNVHWGAAARMLAGGLPGVILGGVLLESLSSGATRGWVLLAVGLVVFSAAGAGLIRARRPAPVERTGDEDPSVAGRGLGVLSFPIGLEVGFSSAGAGALGTLLLLHRTALPTSRVIGTDLAFGLGLAAVGGGLHMSYGSWDPTLLVQLGLGGVVGALAGARLASRVPARPLRLVLLGWLVFIGGQLAYRGLDQVVAPSSTREQPPADPPPSQ